MPYIISKPTVLICGSKSIKNLDISRYIRPQSVGAVISGGASGVDTIVERWAKNHKIEFIAYTPNYKVFGKRAPLERDKDMVDAADVVFCFWDMESTGTLYTYNYAKSMGRKTIVHIVLDYD